MIIGIDGNEANVKKRVGIGQYAYQMLVHLDRIRNSDIGFRKKEIKFKIYLKDDPSHDLPHESDWWSYKVIGPRPLWTQFALPMRLLFSYGKPNVFYSPTHYAPRI